MNQSGPSLPLRAGSARSRHQFPREGDCHGANSTIWVNRYGNLGAASKKQLATSFRRRGMVTATMSGVAYGTYTAFMTLAMTLGVWGVWYGGDSTLSEFSKLFLLGALGAATTDACSAVWAVLIAIGKGKFGDVFRSMASKPGAILMGAAVIGGPLPVPAMCLACRAPVPSLCPSARFARPSAPF